MKHIFASLVVLLFLFGCSEMVTLRAKNGRDVLVYGPSLDGCTKTPPDGMSGLFCRDIGCDLFRAEDYETATEYLIKSIDLGYYPSIYWLFDVLRKDKSQAEYIRSYIANKITNKTVIYVSPNGNVRPSWLYDLGYFYGNMEPINTNNSIRYYTMSCYAGFRQACEILKDRNISVDNDSAIRAESDLKIQDDYLIKNEAADIRRLQELSDQDHDRNLERLKTNIDYATAALSNGIQNYQNALQIQTVTERHNQINQSNYADIADSGSSPSSLVPSKSAVNTDMSYCITPISAKFQEHPGDQKTVMTVRVRNNCSENIKMSICIEQSKGPMKWVCSGNDNAAPGYVMSYSGVNDTGQYRYVGCKRHPKEIEGYRYGVCSAEP